MLKRITTPMHISELAEIIAVLYRGAYERLGFSFKDALVEPATAEFLKESSLSLYRGKEHFPEFIAERLYEIGCNNIEYPKKIAPNFSVRISAYGMNGIHREKHFSTRVSDITLLNESSNTLNSLDSILGEQKTDHEYYIDTNYNQYSAISLKNTTGRSISTEKGYDQVDDIMRPYIDKINTSKNDAFSQNMKHIIENMKF